MSNVSGFLVNASPTATDLVGEWMDEILVRQGKSANLGSTLFGLMSRLPAERTDNTIYNWWERNPVRRSFYINNAGAAYDDTTATIVVDDGASTPGAAVWQVLNKDAFLISDVSGEIIRVTADPSSNSIAIERGRSGTTAAASGVANNALWTLISTAKAEGADPVKASYEQPEYLTNYIQTFNSTVFLANSLKNNVLRTDKEGAVNQLISQQLEKIANDIEFQFLIGGKGQETGSSNGNSNALVYTTGGLKAALDAASAADSSLIPNILSGNGSSGNTLKSVKDWLSTFMTNGSDTKLALCGPKAYAAFSDYANTAAGGFRIMNNEGNVFGMNITNIQTPFGELSLAMHPLLKNAVAFNDWMFVVDLQLIAMKVQEELLYEDNIQLPGQDSYKGQFRAKLGLKQKFAGAFGYAKNLELITA